uniref:Retinochrome2 n=1 Tax=Idiosepius paradoxus TaxID=294707 RepID=A0A0H5B8L2_IDIPA|nr:retinochrome2 [Idiosepius paradoxus]
MFGPNPTALGGSSHLFTMWEHSFAGAIYMLIGCFVYVTCGATAVMLSRQNTQPRRKYTTLIYFLLACIAVNGANPFHAASCMAGKWIFGETGCIACGFYGFLAGISQIWCLFAFCVERYIATNFKSFYKTIPSIYYTLTVLTMIGIGLFWAFMPILGWSQYGLESPGTSCSIDYSVATEHYQSLLISMSLVTYGAPLMGSYWAVSKAMTALKNTPEEERIKDTHLLSEEQLTALAATFIPVALISWSGFAYIALYAAFTNKGAYISNLAGTLPPLMAKFGCTLYPIFIFLARVRTMPKVSIKKL